MSIDPVSLPAIVRQVAACGGDNVWLRPAPGRRARLVLFKGKPGLRCLHGIGVYTEPIPVEVAQVKEAARRLSLSDRKDCRQVGARLRAFLAQAFGSDATPAAPVPFKSTGERCEDCGEPAVPGVSSEGHPRCPTCYYERQTGTGKFAPGTTVALMVSAYNGIRDTLAILVNAQCEARDDAESKAIREARESLEAARASVTGALQARGWLA